MPSANALDTKTSPKDDAAMKCSRKPKQRTTPIDEMDRYVIVKATIYTQWSAIRASRSRRRTAAASCI